MKKFIFLSILACIFCFSIGNISKGEIPVKDYMSYEFLDTQGYSDDMLLLVEINKAKTFGEELPEQWPTNPIKRAYKKIMSYLDPATDYGDFGRHEIKMESTWRDY